MKGLILKDILSMKKEYGVFFLCFIAAMIICRAGKIIDPSMLVVVCIIISSTLMTISFSYDEKCGFMQYGLTTPVKRRAYVWAKYILALMNSAAAALLVAAGSIVLTLKSDEFSAGGIAAEAGLIALISLIFSVWEISLSIRKNSVSAGLTMAVLFFTILLLLIFSLIIGGIVSSDNNNIAVPSILCIIFVLIPVITVILFCMSFRWAERKEF